MDLKEGHLKKAESFERFLSRLVLNHDSVSRVIIASFYEALHYGAAFLTTKNKSKVDNHPQMLKLLEIYLPRIHKDYSDLFQASWLARYADIALGTLSGMGETLPNPHLLTYPFIRREAVLSSRIEGTQSSLSDLLLTTTFS